MGHNKTDTKPMLYPFLFPYAQGLLLAGSGQPYMVPGVKLGSAICKASTFAPVLSPAPMLYSFLATEWGLIHVAGPVLCRLAVDDFLLPGGEAIERRAGSR